MYTQSRFWSITGHSFEWGTLQTCVTPHKYPYVMDKAWNKLVCEEYLNF